MSKAATQTGSTAATKGGIPVEFQLPASREDEMRAVSVATPLPDLLPRSYDDIKRMRKLRKDAESGRKYVAPKRVLPPPYVNDEECDEFEDATIKMDVEFLSDLKEPAGVYKLAGPNVEGVTSSVFEVGMLYKIITEDNSWYFYNDTEKYEMLVKFRFGSKSELQPGPNVEMFVKSNKELEASLTVYPGQTEKLITGKVNGFKCMAKAQPLSDSRREQTYAAVNKEPQQELERIADFLGYQLTDLDEGTVLDCCQKQDLQYIDCQFRPCDDSLYRYEMDTYRIRSLPWRRAEGYIPPGQRSECRIFRRTILPSHVTQGDIGNSYLISAMAVLAERPAKIRDLFRHPMSAGQGKSERTIGAYWVTINYNGWWCPVLLDEYFPAFRDGPEFARCGKDLRRLWVPLLEKAYAKIHESYANIASGDPLEPLQDFTGFPVTRFDHDWEAAQSGDDALFKRLVLYNKKGYIIMLCTPREEAKTTTEPLFAPGASMSITMNTSNANVASAGADAGTIKELALSPYCGYAVIDVRLFEDQHLHLVRIRNPHGTGEEWKGSWSRSDKRWDKFPQVRDACYPNPESMTTPDGTFWMEWSDAVKRFSGGGVCHVRDEWYDYRIRGSFLQGIPSVCLEVNVADPLDVFLILSQDDERAVDAGDYAAMLISISRHGNKNEKIDCSSTTDVEKPDLMLKFNFSRDVAMKYTFKPDDCPYFVVPRIHDASIDKPYVLGIIMDTYAGNGNKIEFKKLDRACKVFHNMPSFTVNGLMEDVAAEYQVRTSRQPMEEIGSELKDVRLNEFGINDGY